MILDKPEMGNFLVLHRCPHCQIARPLLSRATLAYDNANKDQRWAAYVCSYCDGVVTARGSLQTVRVSTGRRQAVFVDKTFPDAKSVEEELPERARRYLEQAHQILGDSPDAAAVMASSSVDAMLKNKGFADRKKSLHNRIDEAVEAHLLTEDMAKWAHHVRFMSNSPRHADDDDPYVSPEQARTVVDFADALGEFLFVLPSRAERAISDVKKPEGS